MNKIYTASRLRELEAIVSSGDIGQMTRETVAAILRQEAEMCERDKNIVHDLKFALQETVTMNCSYERNHRGKKSGNLRNVEVILKRVIDELGGEDEKPLHCQFCGGKCSAETVKDEDSETGEVRSGISVLCYGKTGVGCGYQSKCFTEESEAIAAHNRVCRAVEAAKKGEAK